ncbi:helix-turn-helix domain-containing protein [Microbulbifer elongatus]|nr:helix-turn-helix domain-containing protein [Microbulbifer elongatus]
MNRGLARQETFLSADCYSAFLDTLSESHQRFQVHVHAYCLMGNHYHLLLHTPQGNLSRAMRHINGVYTQRFNRLHGRDGPLFRGRYKAILVEADQYHLSLTRYIHRNPIETRRPLADQLEEYPWSSYPAYLNLCKSPGWLYRDFTYAALGRRDKYRGYRQFVEQGVDEEVAAFYERQRQSPFLGGEVFQEEMRSRLGEIPPEVSGVAGDGDTSVGYVTIVEVVAMVFERQADDLYKRSAPGRSGANPARAVAMWLCQDLAGMTLPEIGEVFGGVHYSAVSQAVRRIKEKVRGSAELSRLFEAARVKVSGRGL